MKTFLRPKHLPFITLIAGVVGFLLRLWTLSPRPDSEGLYQPQPLAWTLLWIVTALLLISIPLSTTRLKRNGHYTEHFPASVVGGVGTLLAALGITVYGFSTMITSADLLTTVVGILGVSSGVCMVVLAFARFNGEQPNFLFRVIVCLFLAVRIFVCCRNWSNEPQIGIFLFPFLASICMMLACYQLCCFDVNIGKRRQSLFWSLSGVYFCILSLPGNSELLFYGSIGVWLATNLCALRPLKRKPGTTNAPTEEPAAAEEISNPTE